MGETLYTYRRVKRADGTETYERVEYDPRVAVSEPPVLVPKYSPMFKNGEVPGSGSTVVDLLLAKTAAADARRDLLEAQEARAEANRINAQLGRTQRSDTPRRPAKPYGRVLEP